MPSVPFNEPDLWTDGDISEKIAGISPGVSSLSIEGDSRATLTYIVNGPNKDLNPSNPLALFCQQVLGETKINEVDGSLIRTPPMTHPQYRWLYADRISSIKGIGLERKVQDQADSGLLSWDTSAASSWQYIPPYYVIYDKYEVVVEFSTKPYLVVSDAAIDKLNEEYEGQYRIDGGDGTYYMDDGSQNAASGNPIREYKRFTTYTTESSAEYLTMKGGAYKFASDVEQVNGQTIVGFYGKTLLPKVVFKLTWFQVPYEFVDPTNDASTNIYEALGRVNQNYWYGFEPGELLFTGFTNTQKIRNQFDFNSYSLSDLATLPTLESLLYTDITLNFLYIPIFSTDVNGDPYPSEPAGIINPNNKSYINAGHNLAMSNVNKRYYPVVSEDVESPVPEPEFRKKPIYNSYPFELIFNAFPYKMATVPTP
jgi:hypothetical protein